MTAARWVVTGASRGIGLAISERARAGGAEVAALARRWPGREASPPSADRRTAADGRAPVAERTGGLRIAADVTDAASLDRAMAEIDLHLGGIDVLVLNAGVHRGGRLGRLRRSDWDAVLDTNLGGAFATLSAARPLLREGGAVVAIGAVVGLRGFPGDVAYASSKAGLAGMVRALAVELAPAGIRVNLVIPGYTETEMTGGLAPAVRESLIRRVPLGRPARTEEVAEVVDWVARATYMTGALVPVDGGLMAALGSAA